MDTIILNNVFGCSFAAKKELASVPLAGHIFKALNLIFIDRGGTPEELNKIVLQIGER